MLKEGNVSWHPNLLKHVVHLDQVYLFAQNEINHVEFDVEGYLMGDYSENNEMAQPYDEERVVSPT